LLRLLDELLAASDRKLPADAGLALQALATSGGVAARLARSILGRRGVG
jgi:hypothetical protein